MTAFRKACMKHSTHLPRLRPTAPSWQRRKRGRAVVPFGFLSVSLSSGRRRCRRCAPGVGCRECRFVFATAPSLPLVGCKGVADGPCIPDGNCSSRTWQDSGNSLGSSLPRLSSTLLAASLSACRDHPSETRLIPAPCISLTNSSFPTSPAVTSGTQVRTNMEQYAQLNNATCVVQHWGIVL